MKKYWNNQLFCECQLVALWNAAIFWDIKVPFRYGHEYVEDCLKASAISGGCINIEHVIKKLKLKAIMIENKFNEIKNNLPVEFKIFCHRGYHSVLAIDVDTQKRVLLANYAKNKTCWIQYSKLKKMHNKNLPLVTNWRN
jgi:hypothetical protein